VRVYFYFRRMKNKNLLRSIILIAIVVANIGCDQITKKVIRNKMELYSSIAVVENHITLIRVENTGAFLSMGNNWPNILRLVLLNGLPIFAIGFGLYYILKNNTLNKYVALGICCMMGGGIGNLIDRLLFGAVTDFMYLYWGNLHTGVFNAADVSITGGALLVLLASVFTAKKK
jgi:signal peptidase II